MDLKPNMANFFNTVRLLLFCRKKFPNSRKEILVVNSDFFLTNKNISFRWKKVRHVGFQVHQKSSKSARIGSGKKMLKLGTPIEISTKRQQNQAIVALVWSMLALIPVKKSTALLQTTITFVPSLRLSYFFVLIAAEFDRPSEKRSRRERFAHPVARYCADCRRFLACFCL